MTLDPADRKFAPGGSQNPAGPEAAPPSEVFPDVRRARTPVGFADRESVLADPLQQRTRFVNPELVRQRTEARPRVMAALALHLGGHVQGLGGQFEQAVGPLADRFLDIAEGDPALIRAIEEDVNALWALSDEAVAAKVARGEPLTSFEPILDSLADVYWSVGADALYERLRAEEAEQMRRRYEAVGEDLDVAAGMVELAETGRLVLDFDNLPPTGGEQTRAAVVDAFTRVGKFVDGTPGGPRALDVLWAATAPVFGVPRLLEGGTEKITAEEDQRSVAEATRLASVLPFPDELMVAQVAAAIISEGGIGSADALDLAAQVVDTERDNLESEWRRLTKDELIEQAEQAGEAQSTLGQIVDDATGRALETMQAWDAVTQRLGVNAVDFVWDASAAAWHSTLGDADEGARRFTEMWDAPLESDVAEYWGLEGAGADVALFATGAIFDPTTFAFGGSRGAAKLFSKAMTEPRFAPVAMRLGPMRQITRNIADETGSKAIRSVLSLSGISDRGYVELLDLARRPGVAKAEVEAALMRELPSTDGVGFFLAEGPRRAYRRSTAQGVASTLENISSVPAEKWPELFRSLSRLGRSRSMHLGESTFLDDFFDMVVTVKPDDADFLEAWATRAVDAVSAGRGAVDARRGVLTMRKQRTRDLLDNMAGARSNIVDDPVGIRNNMTELRRVLDSPDLPSGMAAQVNRLHGDMSQRLARAEGKHGTLIDKSRQLNRELGAATRLEAELATPETRLGLAEVVGSFYDDWAERINAQAGRDVIPIKEGVSNPLAPGVPVRDWSAVTGSRKGSRVEDDLTLTMGLAGDDVDLASDLGAVGMFNRSTTMPLPASPYELVVFEKLATKGKALAAWHGFVRNERARRAVSTVKTVFAANLLLNPVTALKVHGDETLRFLADTGRLGGFFKSTLAVIPGTGRMVTNPWAAQYGRRLAGIRPEELTPWQWVDRPKTRVAKEGYRRQAERWVNGTLLNDDVFRNYAHTVRSAKFVDDATFPDGRRPIAPAEFRAWWEDGVGAGRPGRANARDSYLRGDGSPVELDADGAFATVHRAFKAWISTAIDPKARGAVADALLDSAAGRRLPLNVAADARIFNAIRKVPGKGNTAGLLDGAFSLFFGGPAQRRGSAFFDHYHREALDMYRSAYQAKGRLITRDMLMERAGMAADEADWALRQGADNAFVKWLMDGSGAVTERTLEAQAARYAARRSDDLLYRFTASSIAGSTAEAGLLFPFARASLDFLSWWGDHLTRPLQFRLGPRAREAIQTHPLAQRLLEAGESVPLNVRALAKFAHLETTVNNEYDSPFDQAIGDLTFLPTRWSREILMGVTPTFGPVPSWLVDLGAASGTLPDEWVDELEGIQPALGFSDETDDIWERIIPAGGRTLRSATIGALRGVASLLGSGSEQAAVSAAGAADWLNNARQPGYTTRFQAAGFSEWLSANALTVSPGSEPWLTATSDLAVSGMLEANRRDWDDRTRRWIGREVKDPEASYLGSYAALVADPNFAHLVDLGAFDANDLIPDDETGEPRILAVYARVEAGEATAAEKEWLDDALRTVYLTKLDHELLPGVTVRDRLNVAHPELAVNLVGKYQAAPLPTGATEDQRQFHRDHVDPDTLRLDLPPGPAGDDIFDQARRRGWIVNRQADGPDGWMRDAHEAVLESADRLIRGVWEGVTGRSSVGGRLPKSLAGVSFELSAAHALALAATGLDVSAGDEFTVEGFQQALVDHRRRFATRPLTLGSTLSDNPFVADLSRHNDDWGRGLVDAVRAADAKLKADGLSFEDLPEGVGQAIRDRVQNAVTLGYVTEADYNAAGWRRLFGPLDYQPPTPPPVNKLDWGISMNRKDIDDGLEVIDGDTVSVATADGPLRIRLIGINAPEIGQTNYAQATKNLEAVIADADRIVLGVFDPELFGTTQRSGPDDRRLLAWLYVGGTPIYDPSVFGAENPRGAGTGGQLVDLQAIVEAGR